MTLLIENIGRIKNASINMAPLTLFIGKNDSGKTYCASAIWAFIKFIQEQNFQSTLKSDEQAVKTLGHKLKNVTLGDYRLDIQSQQLNNIQKEINQSFSNGAATRIGAAIGYYGLTGGKISSEKQYTPDSFLRISLSIKKKEEINQTLFIEDTKTHNPQADSNSFEIRYSVESEQGELRNIIIPVQNTQLLIQYAEFLGHHIGSDIAGFTLFGKSWNNYRNPLYLPAARTGIMLAIDYFVSGTMERSVVPNPKSKYLRETPNLPAPLHAFAANLIFPYFHPEPKEILKSVVGGKYERTKNRSEYQYTPAELKTPIPLAATSSLVTEMAGFALNMAFVDASDSFVIFEEPEAHLHLDAQREIAKVLVSLVNRGKHLLITTHSDTFLQQINNLIGLHGHPKEAELLEKFGLEKTHTISRERVAAFDFVCTNGKTIVKQLECTRTGFIAPSLNEVLLKIAEETHAINKGFEDFCE